MIAPEVTCIVGSGHSGSTIFQYLLAGATGAVGVGETQKLFGRAKSGEVADRACSCGDTVSECPVWGGLADEPADDAESFLTALVRKLPHIEAVPDASALIDSSKSIETVRRWERLRGAGEVSSVRAVYLVRDARGWAASDRKVRPKYGRPKRALAASMWDWRRQQTEVLNEIASLDSPVLTVSYESLIFDTTRALERLFRFLGHDDAQMDVGTALADAVVHDVFGNRVKSDPEKRSRLVYDDGWLEDYGVHLAALALPPVWQLNARLRRMGGPDAPADGRREVCMASRSKAN